MPPRVGLPARARTLRKSACGIHDRTCNRTEDRAPRAQGLYTAGARLVLRATVRVVISGERLLANSRGFSVSRPNSRGLFCFCLLSWMELCVTVSVTMSPCACRVFTGSHSSHHKKMAAPKVQAENASTPK